MAETAGLVIGAVSLASLFTDCVDCFNYIRIGQTLEDDFPIYQTELDVLQLRFSRWAQAVTEISTKRSVITDDVAPLVENNLKQIAKLFQRAREDAEDYADIPDSSQARLDMRQTPGLAKLRSKLKTIIDRRQRTTKTVGVGERAQCALYKREEFVTLIVNLRTKVDDLETLTSVAELKPMLLQMQIEDAEDVQSKDAKEMKLVEDSPRDVDPAFGLVVEQARLGHSFSNTEIGDCSAVQMGDSVTAEYSGPLSKAYHTYAATRIGKNAQVSMGNMHGRTVFDKTI